jgi:type IV pilus assembly protein PilQ
VTRRVSLESGSQQGQDFVVQDLNQNIKNLETVPVTLKFNSINIRSALKLFAGLVKRNIVIGDEVDGNITLDFQDIKWGSAVHAILDMNDLVMMVDQSSGMLRVHNKNKYIDFKKREFNNSKELASLSNGIVPALSTNTNAENNENPVDQKTEIFKIFYNTSADVVPLLQATVADLTITDDSVNNQLIVAGTPQQLDQVETVLNTIDTPKKAIMIEAYIISAEDGFTKSFDANLVANSTLPGRTTGSNITTGVASTNPGAAAVTNANVGLSGYADATLQGGMLLLGNIGRAELQAVINAAVNDTNSETISNPKLLALNGEAAAIQQGLSIKKIIPAADGQAATTQDVSLNLSMNITPQIRGDKIEMVVQIQNNSPGSSVAGVGNDDVPINNESINSTVQISDGGVAVLGGVYKNTKTDSINFVPILSKIPILGSFFQSKTKNDTKNQLLIFLTANIV